MASKVADAIIEGRQAIAKERGEAMEAAKAAGEIQPAAAEPAAEETGAETDEETE
jgi:hypothetical protein